jgi:hypothetical protein
MTPEEKYIVHVKFESGLQNTFEVMADSERDARQKGKEMVVSPSINYGYEIWAKKASKSSHLKSKV